MLLLLYLLTYYFLAVLGLPRDVTLTSLVARGIVVP